jgi:hypothetical protein
MDDFFFIRLAASWTKTLAALLWTSEDMVLARINHAFVGLLFPHGTPHKILKENHTQASSILYRRVYALG